MYTQSNKRTHTQPPHTTWYSSVLFSARIVKTIHSKSPICLNPSFSNLRLYIQPFPFQMIQQEQILPISWRAVNVLCGFRCGNIGQSSFRRMWWWCGVDYCELEIYCVRRPKRTCGKVAIFSSVCCLNMYVSLWQVVMWLKRGGRWHCWRYFNCISGKNIVHELQLVENDSS